MPGRFITIEGGEGAGKSTHIELIVQWLNAQGIDHLRTREPGGTPLAEEVRKLLLERHDEPLQPMTELLLIFAARAQHLQTLIEPALSRGQWVLCERFTDSTYVYQGCGRGLPQENVATLEALVQGSRRPDYTFLLDVPVEVGLRRAAKRGQLDRFESEPAVFFHKIRNAYLERARREPGRFLVIDANRAAREIARDIETTLARIAGEGRNV
ncbi:MAG: dTMP kinase [Halieaceae bacterium]|nr:dTMP kinase [Halieaceae bacterium]